MAKISCILTSYNKPGYLEEAIESILAQTFKDFELIVMDDRSDNPQVKEALKKYGKDPKVRVFTEGAQTKSKDGKKRQAMLLNRALGLARGEYISYFCDDDVHFPERLEKFLEKFESDSKISVVYCWWRACNYNQKKEKSDFHLRKMWGLRGKKAGKGLKLDKLIDIASFMHKRDCLRKFRKPFWSEKGGEINVDGAFAEKLGEEFIFYPLEEVLYEHHFTPLTFFEPFMPKWKLWAHVVLSRLDYGQQYRFELEK